MTMFHSPRGVTADLTGGRYEYSLFLQTWKVANRLIDEPLTGLSTWSFNRLQRVSSSHRIRSNALVANILFSQLRIESRYCSMRIAS